jgi:DNA polymerase III alpha subunit
MINLSNRTDYSFLRGYGTPEQWLERCKAIGCTAFAVTDLASTWGYVPFTKAFAGSGVKLIYGVQIPVCTLLDKDPKHALVTLLAKNDEGVAKIFQALTLAHKQTYYRPRLTWTQLAELKDVFVIVVDAYPSDYKSIQKVPGILVGLGARKDHMFAFAKSDLPCVMFPTATFPSMEHREAFELVQRIGQHRDVPQHMLRDDEWDTGIGISRIESAQYISRADQIAIHCVARLQKASQLRVQKPLTPEWIAEKAKARGIDIIGGPYAERLRYELGVIQEKGLTDYFAFVADLCDWAKDRMFVGSGRGSSGGSLLCYILGITEVDPLVHGTLFERFIDVTRADWPDIDVDFPADRRDEVFTYLGEKYGQDHVARLGTLSLFGGKSAINDTGKACGAPYQATRELGKRTEGTAVPLSVLFNVDDESKAILANNPGLGKAVLIEDHPRHHGVHAAGVVVTNEPITQFGAVDRQGTISVDLKQAEALNLIKMDALGLRTLSVIQEACNHIGMDPRDLYKLDLNDDKVFEAVFRANAVTSIFQFEGHAVRGLLKSIAVDRFDDLCVLTSLARPGPLIGGAASRWVACRNGEATWEAIHPDLDATFGTICYQEQAMAIVRDLAGFDAAQVNGFRRAVGKKDTEKLLGYRNAFIEGAAQKLGQEKAELLWDEMCEFGSYAFNKSHAVAYSMLSYMSAWLKTYYPAQFALANLKYSADDDHTKQMLRELNGIKFVPFDAERSEATWSIREGVLYGGFDSIIGIGIKTAKALVAKRSEWHAANGAGHVEGWDEHSGPGAWLTTLTASQREKLTKQYNTPWHTLSYFKERYATLYDSPLEFRCEGVTAGFKGPIYVTADLPDQKGNYAFLGRIVRKTQRDKNSPEEVAKRNGQKFATNTYFINLTIQDDAGEVGATINRFKADQFSWLLQENLSGRDFFFRGNIIENGKRWIFIDNIVELK